MDELHKTILVVEDEIALRTALSLKLKNAGFTVLQAEDGEEGLQTALEKHPDMLLVDIIMPKMDGLTMLEKLQEDEWGKQAKVIILSNLGDPEQQSEKAVAGKYEYFVKADLELEQFIHTLKERLGLPA